MSLTDLMAQIDTAIHSDVAVVKQHAQSILGAVDASNVTANNILNDLIAVLNGLNAASPRLFMLYPELAVMVNELKTITGPNTQIDIAVLYRALYAFLNPPKQDAPPEVTPDVVNTPTV